MKFRLHSGGFEESMKTETNIESLQDVRNILRDKGLPECVQLVSQKYGLDRRNGWDTFVLISEHGVVGFTNKELPE